MPFRMASAFFLSLFWSTSFVLGHIAADAPAVVTLYTAFLDPLPEQVSGFSVKYFKLRTMHALVDKANSLKSTSVRVIHVEIPGHDDMIKRVPVAKFDYGAVSVWSNDYVNQDSLANFVSQQLAKYEHLAAGGRVCAVIPARYASVRFPGKMMADILGKSMIQRTFERVHSSPAVAQVFLTTESEELAAHARSFTSNVIISSDRPKNGMYCFGVCARVPRPRSCLRRERLGEIEHLLPDKCQFIVNVHGDEPFLEPSHVATVIDVLLSIPPNHTRIIGASLRTRLRTQQEASSRAKVKMIINPTDETVLYLSRALIPHSKSGEYNPQAVYWSHINIMAYRRGYPTVYAATPTQPAQREEDVEYNKILESGFTFKTAEVDECERDVNTIADLDYLQLKYANLQGEL